MAEIQWENFLVIIILVIAILIIVLVIAQTSKMPETDNVLSTFMSTRNYLLRY